MNLRYLAGATLLYVIVPLTWLLYFVLLVIIGVSK